MAGGRFVLSVMPGCLNRPRVAVCISRTATGAGSPSLARVAGVQTRKRSATPYRTLPDYRSAGVETATWRAARDAVRPWNAVRHLLKTPSTRADRRRNRTESAMRGPAGSLRSLSRTIPNIQRASGSGTGRPAPPDHLSGGLPWPRHPPSVSRTVPPGRLALRRPPPRCAAVLLALAPPSSWGESYPAPPVPSAVAANFVDGFGRPFKPPPWGKRFTLGVAKECAAIIGPPHPGPDGLILCEGLADGLAVAARRWDTVMVTSGIPPHNGAVFDYMGGWPTVTIFRDDEPEGRRATRICCDLLASRHGVNALVETAPKGFKDAAAWAESGEWDHLADLDAYAQDVDEIAADLSREGLNEWESRRRAAMCCAGAIPTSEPETRPATTPPEPVTTSTSTQGYFGGMPRRER